MIITETLPDDSEIVNYDTPGIPYYVKRSKLSAYPNMRAQCHWHDDIECIYIYEGRMNYYVDGKKILLNKGDAIIINSKEMHFGYSYQKEECDFLCILIHPSLMAANKLLVHRFVQPVINSNKWENICVNEREDAKIISILKDIYTCKEAGIIGYEMKIVGFSYQLWAELMERVREQRSSKHGLKDNDMNILRKMVAYIREHYAEKIVLADIAGAGNVCKSKCCSLFKEEMGQTAIEFVNYYRLRMSADIIVSSDYSITQIAYDCGFDNLSYYCKNFKKYFGISPKQYKILKRDI